MTRETHFYCIGFSVDRPKTKPDDISPPVAAAQANWHAERAAGFFIDSLEHGQTSKQEQARRRFLENVRLALPALGLTAVQDTVRSYLWSRGRERFIAEARPVIDALWAELLSKAVIVPVAVGSAAPAGAKDALAQARASLAAAMAQIDAALKMTGSEPGEVGAVEGR